MNSTPVPVLHAIDEPAARLPVPAPQPAAAVRPVLRRSATDRMVGGVCGGLAEYTGIDVLLWRVGIAALTLAGGLSIAVYLALWVLVPAAPAAPAQAPNRVEQLVQRLNTAITSRVTTRRQV
jgi:phage shock protein PspC (stress-responsive transcriptional regulator)